MRILFLGDVVGISGCSKIINNLLSQIEKNRINFVIVNAENADESGVGLTKEISFKATLKNEFVKNKNFTRFVKSKLSTTKDGKLEAQILKGQESFRIKSFIQSNIWVMLPSGKEKFKKGETVDCFFPNQSNIIFS